MSTIEYKRFDFSVDTSTVWALSSSATPDELKKTAGVIISPHDGSVLSSMIASQPPTANGGVRLAAGRSVVRMGRSAVENLKLLSGESAAVNVSVTLLTPVD